MISSFSGGGTGTPMFKPPNGGNWWPIIIAVLLVLTIMMWGIK